MNISLILSSGTGARFGSDLPKQYQLLAGKEVIAYSVEALKASKSVNGIVVIAAKEFLT